MEELFSRDWKLKELHKQGNPLILEQHARPSGCCVITASLLLQLDNNPKAKLKGTKKTTTPEQRK